MKIKTCCMECLNINIYKPLEEYYQVELNDIGQLTFTCAYGHETITNIQEQKFEILFHMGALALLDGYTREAIANTASSLERFYEYFINIICLKNHISLENFEVLWKNVNNQSERQFGAYLFTYFIDKKGNIPKIIDDEKPTIDGISINKTKTWKEFRNNVIHKGYIPSEKEALFYMKLVFDYINDCIKDLKENYQNEISESISNHLSKKHPNDVNKTISTMTSYTILSLTRPYQTFEESIGILKKQTIYSK